MGLSHCNWRRAGEELISLELLQRERERECGIVGGAAAVELVIQKLAAIEDVVVLTAECICCTFENIVD